MTPIAGILLFLVGIRVLLHAREARALPELMVGIWLTSCGLGVVPLQLASVPDVMDPAVAHSWLIVAQVMVTVGFCALAVFVWRTFGVDSSWRRGFAYALIGAQCLALAVLAALDGFWPEAPPFMLVVATLRVVVMGWAFGETVRYSRMMRRRVGLGLADPVVANRFVLWSIWTGSMCFVVLSIIAVRIIQQGSQSGALEIDPHAVTAALFPILAVGGVIAAASMSLSFFPPAAYCAWLEKRARLGNPSPDIAAA